MKTAVQSGRVMEIVGVLVLIMVIIKDSVRTQESRVKDDALKPGKLFILYFFKLVCSFAWFGLGNRQTSGVFYWHRGIIYHNLKVVKFS